MLDADIKKMNKKNIKNISNKRLVFIMVFAICFAFSLNGCRYSTTLEQIVSELHKEDVNYLNPEKPVSNQADNEVKSDHIPNLTIDESSERYEDEKEDLAQHGKGKDDIAAADLQFNQNADLKEKAKDTPTEKQELIGEGDSSQNEEDVRDNGQGEGGTGTQGVKADPSVFSDTGKKVVDAFGRTVEIPENVSSVSAVGNLGAMVLMLGSAEKLIASSQDLVNDSLAREIFPQLQTVPAYWSGDGTMGMQDSQFQELLKAKPQVCMEMSGKNTFSEEQVQTLGKNGITYLVLPDIIDQESLKMNVKIIGTVLGNGEKQNASVMAAEYIDWAEKTLKNVDRVMKEKGKGSGDANSLLYTMFIDEWDSDASYSIDNGKHVTRAGTGVAVFKNKLTDSCKAISNFLSYAGISNATIEADAVLARSLYFTPLVAYSQKISVKGNKADGLTTLRVMNVGGGLGANQFPSLVVPSEEIAREIQKSDLWKNYEQIVSTDGNFYGDGFLDNEGTIISTQVSGEYSIHVNPKGLASWTSGSAESVLESAWAAWKFYDGFAEEEVRNIINDFYKRFYDYELSVSQLNSILAGE